jgi:8-oxo-dGTP pyrophosphatase MutT (NUDIX family)
MAHGPEPGTILNEGEPTEPRQAATVIVLRGGAERLEVLLVQRTPKARFMGGAWVFPGGSTSGEETHREAAVRELHEEAGLRIGDLDSLVPFARWITPPEVTIRFDTWFFLAPAPDGQEAKVDGEEVVDARWVTPADALSGDMLLVFPTIKNLERLALHDSADALLEWAAGREVKPVQPRVEGQGEAARIVLDDEEDEG